MDLKISAQLCALNPQRLFSIFTPPPFLTDKNLGLLRELVRGDLQVKRRGSLPDATAGVVVRTVARAEPSVVLAGVADGDAAQVGADAKDDEPLGLEGPVLVGLLITEGVHGDGGFGGDLVGGAVTDEDGLAAPLDGDGLADIDIGQVELGGGHGQDVGGRGHGGDELHDEDPGRGGVGEANARQHEVGEGTTLGLGHSVNSVGGVSLIDAAELVELGR